MPNSVLIVALTSSHEPGETVLAIGARLVGVVTAFTTIAVRVSIADLAFSQDPTEVVRATE